ncbi:MAG: DUF2490 domain-containing protein [Tannerella sp.]|jgi:hypothetical protein|nr:DUF2490 domain-containing protein [Tannerella sp.]
MKRITCYLLLVLIPVLASSQSKRDTKEGMSLSVTAEKYLRRNLSLNIEEEIRLQTNRIGFDRTVSAAGLDYNLLNRKAKIGVYYAFIYLYNNDYLFEPRHRFYLNLSYKESIESFTVSWRLRVQETVRDEKRGSYRVNPRYATKNKLEVEYVVWGKPWMPFLSCDLSNNLNDPETRYDFVRLRFQGGVNWRLNRTESLDIFLRWDEHLKADDPRVVSLGINFKMRFRD